LIRGTVIAAGSGTESSSTVDPGIRQREHDFKAAGSPGSCSGKSVGRRKSSTPLTAV